jgi:UDP-N-acetyl-D-mannosaminuronate dehydrogenase
MTNANRQPPLDLIPLVRQALAQRPTAHEPRRIGIVGVGAEPDGGEVARLSAAAVLAEFRRQGAELRFHDPHVARFRDATGYEHVGVTVDALLHWSDVIVILAAPAAVEWDHLYANAELVIDAADGARPPVVRQRD